MQEGTEKERKDRWLGLWREDLERPRQSLKRVRFKFRELRRAELTDNMRNSTNGNTNADSLEASKMLVRKPTSKDRTIPLTHNLKGYDRKKLTEHNLET